LGGIEGNGTIQFVGDYSSIGWTVGGSEYWHGFTIGIAGVGSVPERSSLVLISIGLAGLSGLPSRARRTGARRKRQGAH
jgi:hypothetical protein